MQRCSKTTRHMMVAIAFSESEIGVLMQQQQGQLQWSLLGLNSKTLSSRQY